MKLIIKDCFSLSLLDIAQLNHLTKQQELFCYLTYVQRGLTTYRDNGSSIEKSSKGSVLRLEYVERVSLYDDLIGLT